MRYCLLPFLKNHTIFPQPLQWQLPLQSVLIFDITIINSSCFPWPLELIRHQIFLSWTWIYMKQEKNSILTVCLGAAAPPLIFDCDDWIWYNLSPTCQAWGSLCRILFLLEMKSSLELTSPRIWKTPKWKHSWKEIQLSWNFIHIMNLGFSRAHSTSIPLVVNLTRLWINYRLIDWLIGWLI